MRKLAAALMLVTLLGATTSTSAQAQETEIPLGSPMPGQQMSLIDQTGKNVTLANVLGSNATVVVFWSNRCPWTAKYEDRIGKLHTELSGSGNAFVLVNSNDGRSFPDESRAESAKYLSEHPIASFYLTDGESKLARAFGATRAPHIFVFDKNATLVYVGGIDDSPGDPGRVTKEYVRDVLVALAAGRRIESPQTKAFGCMIRLVQ